MDRDSKLLGTAIAHLGQTSKKLQQEIELRQKADTRVRELWGSYKKQKVQLQADHDQVVATKVQLNKAVDEKSVLEKDLGVAQDRLKEASKSDEEVKNLRQTLFKEIQVTESKDQEISGLKAKDEELAVMRADLVRKADEEKEVVNKLGEAEERAMDKEREWSKRMTDVEQREHAMQDRERQELGKWRGEYKASDAADNTVDDPATSSAGTGDDQYPPPATQ